MTTLVSDPTPPLEDPPVEASGRRRVPTWLLYPTWLLGGILIMTLARTHTGAQQLTGAGMFRSALFLSIPVALAGLGGLWSERAGIINIGLEGMMVLGTWAAAYGSIQWGPWQGVVLGIVAGALGGLIHAFMTVTVGVDHIVSGVAINLLAIGVTDYLTPVAWEGKTKESPPIDGAFGKVHLPEAIDSIFFKIVHGLGIHLGDWLRSVSEKRWFLVSDTANLLRGFLLDMPWLVFLGLIAFPITWFILWKTPIGLRIRSTGEDPEAADSLGVKVYSLKYLAVTVSGALAGLGGVILVYQFSGTFSSGQTGGRGYIGLAAMIFGNWNPGTLLAGAGLFGFMDAIQSQVDATGHAMLVVLGLVLILMAARSLWRIERPVAAAAILTSTLLVGAAATWDLGSGLEVVLVVIAAAAGLLALWEAMRSRARFAILATVMALIAFWYHSASEVLPRDFLPYFPHITTMLVLAFASQNLRMPAADGRIWRRSG